MATLVLKLTLAPALVVAASLAGRMWGPRAAGLFGSMPIVAAPVLLALAIDQGEAFAADAAVGTLLAMVAIGGFLVTVGRVSARTRTPGTLGAAWVVFLAGAAVLSGVDVPPLLATAAGSVALAVAAFALPRGGRAGVGVVRPAWDLPLRAAAAAALVLAVTAAADAAGPRLSGALALSPIALSVLCGFSLATEGRPATLVMLRGIVTGLPSVLCFFTIVAITLEPWGIAGAFAAATAVALSLQATVAVATVRVAASEPA